MRLIVTLALVFVTFFLGYRYAADPMLDAATHSVCRSYAEVNGLELVEADGMIGRRSNDYTCEFTAADGSRVFIDQTDGIIEHTWGYRAMRVGGYVVATMSAGIGMGIAAVTGLWKKGD